MPARTLLLAGACSLALVLPLATRAADPQPAQAAPMAMPAGGSDAASSASTDMMQAMQRMQAATSALPMTGNTDELFASMMIPHHQAAIDMAKVELRDGHDPQMRRLAGAVIAAQNKEIAEMQSWLAKHPQ